jgi:hypothetical protein
LSAPPLPPPAPEHHRASGGGGALPAARTSRVRARAPVLRLCFPLGRRTQAQESMRARRSSSTGAVGKLVVLLLLVLACLPACAGASRPRSRVPGHTLRPRRRPGIGTGDGRGWWAALPVRRSFFAFRPPRLRVGVFRDRAGGFACRATPPRSCRRAPPATPRRRALTRPLAWSAPCLPDEGRQYLCTPTRLAAGGPSSVACVLDEPKTDRAFAPCRLLSHRSHTRTHPHTHTQPAPPRPPPSGPSCSWTARTWCRSRRATAA